MYAYAYADTFCFCEYLHENEKFRKIDFACSYGAQVEFFDIEMSKISWDCPYKIIFEM